MRDLSTQVKSANPVLREWKRPDQLEFRISPSEGPAALTSVIGAAPSRALPETGIADVDEGKGKLAPYLKLLSQMIEDQPRAKIKDFYLALKERGYVGSYDLVKKKIHAFRRDLGRQAGATFQSQEAPYAQVEMAKIILKSQPGQSAGMEFKAYLFTLALGHSGRFYAELIEGSDMGTFLQCHQNAFDFLGGVPSGVFYAPQENPTMRRLVGSFPFHLPVADCGQHYGYSAKPTPAFAPWMKGRLKRPGKVLKKHFFPQYGFTTLEKANADMLEWMELSGKQVQIRERKDLFLREKLRALPVIGFNFRGRRQILKLRP